MASNYMFNIFFLVSILHLTANSVRGIPAIGFPSQGEGAHNFSSIGVCYGRLGRSPEEVISIYKFYGINRMRLHEPEHSVLHAVRNSGIHVVLGIRNVDIKQLASSYSESELWIEQNIMVYWPDVRFRYIAVGSHAIYALESNYVFRAMKNLHKAVIKLGLERYIKISTVVGTSLINTFNPPSAGAFTKRANVFMTPIVQFLDKISSPLLVNVLPHLSSIYPVDYALFRSHEVMIKDGDFEYTNLFDTILDAFHIAIKRTGAHRVSVVVSSTGWPFGGSSIDGERAEVYYSNLIRHVSSSRGTPMKRGINIETYLDSMLGVNKKVFTDTH